jgi:ABC-type sugar transport system permease subunit
MMKKKKLRLVFVVKELTKYYKTNKNNVTDLYFEELQNKTICASAIAYVYFLLVFSIALVIYFYYILR